MCGGKRRNYGGEPSCFLSFFPSFICRWKYSTFFSATTSVNQKFGRGGSVVAAAAVTFPAYSLRRCTCFAFSAYSFAFCLHVHHPKTPSHTDTHARTHIQKRLKSTGMLRCRRRLHCRQNAGGAIKKICLRKNITRDLWRDIPKRFGKNKRDDT